jgi:hypothetical protein
MYQKSLAQPFNNEDNPSSTVGEAGGHGLHMPVEIYN